MSLRFKVDENLPGEAVGLLADAGHDASSVVLQCMVGMDDEQVALRCRDESRIVVTMDRGMAVHAISPRLAGVSVLVLRPSNQSKPAVLALIARVLNDAERWPLPAVIIATDDSIRIRSASRDT